MKYFGMGAIAVVAGAVAIWGFGTIKAAGLLPYDDPASVEAGQEVYEEYCAACHGADLSGQENWRAPLDDGRFPAPPHDETGHTWHHPDTQLFVITESGVEALVGGTYKSDMAGFGEILTDDEILEVLAYIKSTWPAQIIRRHNQINEQAGVGQ